MKKILSFVLLLVCTFHVKADSRPNILWFVVDDMSANFSCYGEKTIQTPHVDKLAREGLKFTKAYATSPVCSTFRSAMITGMFQNSIGAHHHRSGRGIHEVVLPEGVRPVPAIFQDAGYYTCMGSGLPDLNFRTQAFTKEGESKRLGKADYNFNWSTSIYNSSDWAGRKKGQPFFMQVQLHGGKLRGASQSHYKKFDAQVKGLFNKVTEPNSVKLPPYYPRDGVFLKDWSTYLDSVKVTDYHVGKVMARLKAEGLLENTIVIFFTDHGISHARGKQFLYDEGTHIPLIIRGPGIPKNSVRKDLVQHIDIAALSLAAAGIELPKKMEGQDILSNNYTNKGYVFAARDRCGEAADRIRSVRSEDFLYIKNFYPERPFLMPSNYKDSKLIIKRMRELHSNKELSAMTEELLFSPTRPAEELYQYTKDGWQLKNLADQPEYLEELKKHRSELNDWIKRTGDSGPESLEVYRLETQDQLKSTRNKESTGYKNYLNNSKLYEKWMSEGK